MWLRLRIILTTVAALSVAALTAAACNPGTIQTTANLPSASDETPSSPDDPAPTRADAAEDENCVSDKAYFARNVWAPIVSKQCYSCHNAQGTARSTSFVLQSEGYGDYLQRNHQTMSRLASTKQNGTSLLLLKPTLQVDHQGGQVIEKDGQEYQTLQQFIDRVDQPTECVAAENTDFFEGVQMHEGPKLLRKATVALASRLPEKAELEQLKASPDELDAVLEEVMNTPAFADTLKQYFNDRLLVEKLLRGQLAVNTLDGDTYPNRKWYEEIEDSQESRRMRNNTNDAIATAPLELIAHVVQNDRPFTEILTADYMLINPFSAKSFGVADQVDFNDPTRYGEFREVSLPGVPAAGIMTNSAFLDRFPTTRTNRNRKRSKVFQKLFLATDILELADQPPDPTESIGHNPTMFDSNCSVCHATLDPVAGAFQNWNSRGRYRPSDDGWHTDMFPPGFGGTLMPDERSPDALAWLADQVVQDRRFVIASVGHAYYMLTGQRPLSVPTQTDQDGYEARFRAWEAQQVALDAFGDTFIESNYDFKTLLKAVIRSPYFRAANVSEVSEQRRKELADLGVARLLAPRELHEKIVSTFGQPWRENGRSALLSTRGYKMVYGGIDSDTVIERMTTPNGLMAAVARRMANTMACLGTAADLDKPTAQRRLFPYVQVDTSPASDEQARQAIRENIQYLHGHILGKFIDIDAPEVDVTYQLFKDVWQMGVDGEHPETLPGRCQAPSIQKDPNHTVRAWMAVVTYLLSDFNFLYR
jgi:cytochrome c5